ncbi:hypothetical protein ACEQPO_25575 [Bacillus sp. SL00103]
MYTFEMLASHFFSLSLLIGHHLFSYIFHVYKQVWAYTGVRELFSLMKTFVCSFFIFNGNAVPFRADMALSFFIHRVAFPRIIHRCI